MRVFDLNLLDVKIPDGKCKNPLYLLNRLDHNDQFFEL